MRILFLTRASLYSNRGGDTTQVLKTAEALNNLGVRVDVLTTDQKIDYKQYDLIHFFNIIRPADILKHVELSNLPFVVSTIYVDYSSIFQEGIKRTVYRVLGKYGVEYIKTIARYLVNGEKIGWRPYWWKGHRAAIQQVLNRAAYLLPNSHSEYQRLKKDFPTAGRYEVIPNGVELSLFNIDRTTDVSRDDRMVLCVARIEPIKNQYRLIKALNNTEFELYLIGKASTNQKKYYETCKAIAAKNIHFLEGMNQSDLLPYYAKAKVHVLPSWFETTGLSSLEAAIMGCNIVVTDKGDTKDYFQEDAFYCDPGNASDIYQVIQKAANTPTNNRLKDRIQNEYHWDRAAQLTLNIYKKIFRDKI